jgi:hypothetical protein
MKKLIIVLGLMLFSFASATDWFEIMDKIYLDLDTIEFQQRKKQVTFWFKALNKDKELEFEGKKIWFTVEKYTIDCKNKTLQDKAFYIFDMKGSQIAGTHEPTSEARPIIPGTRADGWEMLMCRLMQANPKVKKFDKYTSVHRFEK